MKKLIYFLVFSVFLGTQIFALNIGFKLSMYRILFLLVFSLCTVMFFNNDQRLRFYSGAHDDTTRCPLCPERPRRPAVSRRCPCRLPPIYRCLRVAVRRGEDTVVRWLVLSVLPSSVLFRQTIALALQPLRSS